MNNGSIGDLAQSFMLRQRNSALKIDQSRLIDELATGQVSDVRKVLAGNFSYLTELERRLEVLDGYSVATAEAMHFASATQSALERVQEIGQTFSESLIVAGTTAIGTSADDTAFTARVALDAIVGTLNTGASGRSLFGGTATDRPPLQSADELLSALNAAMAGATTPTDMMIAAQNWFDDPAGFDAIIYQGSDDALAPFSLSSEDNVSLDVRATDDRIKDILRNIAVSALASDPAFSLNAGQQSDLYLQTGTELLSARDQMISLRARIGFNEARIDVITTHNAAEITSMEFAKGALLDVDEFETATRLEEVQFQLQSLYATTVRMSQLSLVNFL